VVCDAAQSEWLIAVAHYFVVCRWQRASAAALVLKRTRPT
jgi:hypothetical protein